MPQRLDEYLGSDSARAEDVTDSITPMNSAQFTSPPAGGAMRLDHFMGQPTQNMGQPAQGQPIVNQIVGDYGGSPEQQAAMTSSLQAQMAHPVGTPAQPQIAPQQPMGPIRNAMTAGFHSLESLGNVGIRVANRVGLLSDETAQRGISNQLFHPEEGRTSATVGSFAGKGVEAVAAGPFAPATFAVQGAEDAKEGIEARQAAGEQISNADQIANVTGQAALNYALGKFAPGQSLNRMITSKLPGAIARTVGATAIGAAEGGATQVGANAIDKATIDPNRQLSEGVGTATAGGAVMGGVGHAVHEGTTTAAARLFKPRSTAKSVEAPQENQRAANPDEQAQKPSNDAEHSGSHLVPGEPSADQPADQQGQKGLLDRSKVHNPDVRQEPATTEEYTGASAAEKNLDFYAKDKAGFNKPGAEKGNALEPADKGRLAPAKDAAGPEQAASEHPAELSDASEVGKWYSKTFNDPDNAPVIEAMASMGKGKYKLADVPSEHVDSLNFNKGDKDQSKVDAISKLSPEDRAKLPPAILIPAGRGKLASADGSHRTLAAQKLGKPVRAYVPEEYIGKNGITEAGVAAKVNPEVPVEQKSGLAGRLAARRANDRSGAIAVPDSVEKLFERDIRPAAEKSKINAKTTWDSLNRAIGSGLNLNLKDRDTALNIRTSLGKQDLDRVRTEEAFKPYREHLEGMTDKDKTLWVDQVEAIGTAPDAKTQPVVDHIRKLNDQNIAEGERYGLKTEKWDSNYIGRMAEFPNDEEGSGRHSIAGSQRFLHGRVFDTYSDFKKAVEAQGGKMKYDNPLDVQLSKQSELRKSIEARKIMYGEEDKKQMAWVEDGKPMPEGMSTRLNDPLAKQERPVVAPKWMIGKLAKLAHFDAQKYMEGPEWKKHSEVLRPGEKMPDGYAQTGETKKGQFVANDNVAGLFNNFISPGVTKELPVWDQIVKAKRATVAANLGLSAVHAVLESIGNGIQSVGRSLSNVGHGEFDLASKNLMRAMPWEQARFGKQIGEQAKNPSAHPSLEPLVQTSVEGGNKFGIKSVLDESSWEAAKEEWANGNKIGAVPRALNALYEKMNSPLFDHFIPALRRGAKAAESEMAIRRNMSGQELRRHMGLAQDDIDNMLGTVIRTHQFQNKIVTDVQDLLFTAPKFSEGTLRFAGAATRDIARALSDAAHGKKPSMTPAMYTALGGLMAHAFGGAVAQLAYTYATTGKAQMPNQLRDYIAPRTGRKDDQGREERVSILSPFSFLFGIAKGGTNAVTSRVAPIWHGVVNAAQNVDEHGVQIRNPDDNVGRQALDTGKYLGKQILPFSVQNIMESQKPGASKTWDARLGDVVGAHFGHTSATDAEQAARDVLGTHRRAAPLTRAEADKGELVRGLADEVKGKAPNAWSDVRQAMKEGKITSADVSGLSKKSTEQPGLPGLLQHSSLSAKDIMEQVWPKMTADEKRKNQWMVRGRIGRSVSLTPAQQQAFFKQIGSDVKATVAQ